jgi:hypothetical protein
MKHQHRGFEFEITFCDPCDNWRTHKGEFCLNVFGRSLEYYQTYSGAKAIAELIIDEFVEHVPQTRPEWLAAFDGCMIWTGYEECHLDKAMILSLLEKASKYYKPQPQERKHGDV